MPHSASTTMAASRYSSRRVPRAPHERQPASSAGAGAHGISGGVPRSQPSGAEDFFYWSTVDFGLKPTVRANHVIIYPLAARPSGVSHVIANKQLYASHSTLELQFLVDDERRANRPGFYLLSITRSRIDGTSGLKGSLLRSVISRRSRTALRGYLEHLKRQVERTAPF
jgi:hypothetical protein